MKWVFWMSATFIAYTYLGYPLWLWIRSRWCRKPVRSGPYIPFLSIVMIVRNEEKVLPRKLRNLLDLNYPDESLEIVMVSDGSTDSTNQILSEHTANPRIRVIFNPQQQGKAAGLNAAMSSVRGEIVVFTDARQQIEPDAIRVLVENFADPEIGCASGELMLGDPETGEAEQGMGVYWRIEKAVRGWVRLWARLAPSMGFAENCSSTCQMKPFWTTFIFQCTWSGGVHASFSIRGRAHGTLRIRERPGNLLAR